MHDIFNRVGIRNLNEKLRSCQLLLVGSAFERERHKFFNHAIENLNATIVDEKFNFFSTTQIVQPE